MLFDELYINCFGNPQKIGADSVWSGDCYNVSMRSFEIFDGVRLDFSHYSGNFSKIYAKRPRIDVMHLGYFVRGKAIMELDENYTYKVRSGDCWGQNLERDIDMTEDADCFCICFYVDSNLAHKEISKILRNIDIKFLNEKLLHLPIILPIHQKTESIFDKLVNSDSQDLYRLAFLEFLLVLNQSKGKTPTQIYIENVRKYCEECPYCDKDELEERFCVPSEKIMRDFRNMYGQSLQQYLKKMRMRHAQHLLLSTEKTVSEIASIVGFCNASKFSDAFRKETGVLPRAFRQEQELQYYSK